MDKVNRFFRYLYDPEPMNESEEPIVCLAKTYTSSRPDDPETTASQVWPEEFLRDHESRFWFTYRTGFEKIMRECSTSPLTSKFIPDGFTADTGFGCMIRSAQTLLANAISILRLGRDWRRGLQQDVEGHILRLFADDSGAPYSIHKFIAHGASACDKPAGQWFGPNAASLCISALTAHDEDSDLRVYVASEQGGTIYEDAILELSETAQGFSPLLILIPQRLGHERINPKYHESLIALFDMPQFMGIAGGRPSSAHYFFARQGEKLFFLDPHFPRPSLPLYKDLARYSNDDFDGVHTRRVRRMPLADLDPSMLIGFLIRSKDDWFTWKKAMTESQGKMKIASIAESRPTFINSESEEDSHDSIIFPEDEGLQ